MKFLGYTVKRVHYKRLHDSEFRVGQRLATKIHRLKLVNESEVLLFVLAISR